MRTLACIFLFLPFVAAAQQVKTINITATANPWQFSPSLFTVDEGDIVTLNISVPAGDGSPSGHGFQLSPYVSTGLTVPKGTTRSVTFNATTAGTFFFVCTVPTCGSGHDSMIGKMIVNGSTASGPTISSVSPDTGPTSGGTVVTISGSGFAAPASVAFGPFQGTGVAVTDASTIQVLTPVGPSGQQASLPLDVVVQTPGGSATKTGAFHYFVPPLSITSVRPALGKGGAVVTITGAGFSSALPLTVTFGGIVATASVVDAITIQATAPAHANGAVDVAVRLGGTTATKTAGFTYGDGRRRAVRH